MAELAAAVAVGLEPEGWRRRDRGSAAWASFTRSQGDELCATIELRYASVSSSPWPAPLSLRFGVGYEPATALMPVVTMRWHFALVDEAAPDDGRGPLAITGPENITEASDRIVRMVKEHGLKGTERYPSVADLETRLAGAPGSEPAHHEVLDRAVLLAACGRHDAARKLIDAYAPQHLSETEELAYRRFVRQLGRWLDAGGPTIPPLEESLREMPELRMPAPPSSRSRQQAHASREAVLAARDKAAGKSHAELGELIVAEFSSRGLDLPSPSELAIAVEMLETGRQPFGKARQSWRALRLSGRLLGDTVGVLRGRQGSDPDWLKPAQDASYPVRALDRFVAVEVAPDAAAVLRRACAEAPRRMGPLALVELWLSEAGPVGDGPVTVHLGENTIGTLAPSDAAELADHRRAAAARGEKVRIRGRLYAGTGEGGPLVEIGLPRDA